MDRKAMACLVFRPCSYLFSGLLLRGGKKVVNAIMDRRWSR